MALSLWVSETRSGVPVISFKTIMERDLRDGQFRVLRGRSDPLGRYARGRERSIGQTL